MKRAVVLALSVVLALGVLMTPAPKMSWQADAEKPLEQEWAGLSTIGHCADIAYPGMTDSRISRVSSPVAQGNYAYEMSLQDGDECYSERAELGQGNPTRSDMLDRLFYEGDERWISFQVQLGDLFPLNPGTWQLVMQLKQLGSRGSPIMALEVQDNQWQLARTTHEPHNQYPPGFQSSFPLGASRTGIWTKMTWHVKFSLDSNVGFLEIYGDLGDGQGMRQLLPRQEMSTMKIDETTHQTIPSHARIGIYRDTSIAGNVSVYFDGYTVATTREAAEANAFR
jgi:Polysaccharide lyase